MKRYILYSALGASLLAAGALHARDISKYIDWGPVGHKFPENLESWTPGAKWTEDDNFFISRVRPRTRFINRATQVHPGINDSNDKNLIYWVPIGTPPHNALQSDQFDSDVFSMWPYVTHFGNWSTPLARIPGNFLDVAHRNGVGVSPVVATPWGNMNRDWSLALRKLVDAGPEKMDLYLDYYGIDGLGYNSEFSIDNSIPVAERLKSVYELIDFNVGITRLAKERGNDAFTNIWYDGTNVDGYITFDNGLGKHNRDTFGRDSEIASSLFFNYNWNNGGILQLSGDYARSIGRSPFDIYCGFNMQGGEPAKTTESWTQLKKYPLSIGLWGAHSESMMYESRRELGSTPAAIQRNYLLRTEWWFTGGTRNPASSPEISDTWNYSGRNTGFFGMSRLMSARSAISEGFTTCFNIGNGTFFKRDGILVSGRPWANIGIQDILPTWRFWWSSRLLGGSAEDVPASGMDAEFTWDDAWFGGSCLRIFGSIDSPEYLHLYKTSVEVGKDDEILLRFKHRDGRATFSLFVTLEGDENTEISLPLALESSHYPSDSWHTLRYDLEEVLPEAGNKKVALIGIRVDNAMDADILLGELALRPVTARVSSPGIPEITTTELLSARHEGVDGKIIWNMPQSDIHRYNEDHGVEMFTLWSQQEGAEAVMQSATTSWAGLLLNAPIDPDKPQRMRFGVGTVSEGFRGYSEPVWGEWHEIEPLYEVSDEIEISASEVYPGENVTFSLKDPCHPGAVWSLGAADGGNDIKSGNTPVRAFEITAPEPGAYTLTIEYTDKKGVIQNIRHESILRVLEKNVGRAPKIKTLELLEHDCEDHSGVAFAFTADAGEGSRTRGLSMTGCQFGAKCESIGMKEKQNGTVAFWLRADNIGDEELHLFSIRDKGDSWPRNEWGFMYATVCPGGRGVNLTVRQSSATVEHRFSDVYIPKGVWTSVAVAMEYNQSGALTVSLWINGVKHTPTSYIKAEQETEGAPSPITGLYGWRRDNVVSIGGTLFKTGGVEGAIDNFQYWKSSFSQEEAQLAMSDLNNAASHSPNLDVLVTFDNDCLPDFSFKNEITGSANADAELAAFHYDPQLTEGSGKMAWRMPVYGEGMPMASDDHALDTKVIWKVPGGKIVNSEGDASEGWAGCQYYRIGQYKATLRLENICGADERTIENIFIPNDYDEEGVDGFTSESPYAVNRVMISRDGLLALHFEGESTYRISICDITGRILYQNIHSTSDGKILTIAGMPADIPLVITSHPLR